MLVKGMPATVNVRTPRIFAVAPFGCITVVIDRPVGGVSTDAWKALISAPVSRFCSTVSDISCVDVYVGSSVVVTLSILQLRILEGVLDLDLLVHDPHSSITAHKRHDCQDCS